MTRARPTWRPRWYRPKHREPRTARATTSGGTPGDQYDAARAAWTAARSSRAGSVEIVYSPRLTSTAAPFTGTPPRSAAARSRPARRLVRPLVDFRVVTGRPLRGLAGR